MKRNQHGFTLMELLVVIAIISVLAGMILTATQLARGKAQMARCKAQLKNFSMAIDGYKLEWDQDLPFYISNMYGTTYGSDAGYVCPQDWSGGKEGGVPDKVNGTSTAFMSSQQFKETDDTEFNSTYSKYRNTEIERCSYLYEFCIAPCSWAPGYTWLSKKVEQMREGADGKYAAHKVPIVRCFWHGSQRKDGSGYVEGARILNVSASGRNVFFSRPKWEEDL